VRIDILVRLDNVISLSWSRFKVHKTCSLQYHLKYVQKVRLHKSNLLFLVGSTVHDSVKNWTRNGYPENTIKDITLTFFNSLSKGFKLTNEKRLDFLKQSVRASVIAERLYRRLGIPEHNSCIEERFNQPFGDGDRLMGIVDVLDLSSNTVYDLKNYTKDPSNYEEEQIYVYALAQQIRGQPMEMGGFITPLLEDKIHLLYFQYKNLLLESLKPISLPLQ